jgi:DNA repair exonuclease SbcCD ATPase subunit
MRLELQEIIIKDFKAFKGEHCLPLGVSGVTFLFGENLITPSMHGNGAAKSTIWDALMWCLYGRTPRGLRNPEVVPWSGGKTSVGVIIKIDGRVTEFLRTLSPSRFTCDGEDIADFASAFGVGFELAINTILLPQGKDLFLERTPGDKMKLFSEALDLKRWDIRSDAASIATTALNAEVIKLESEKASETGALDEVVQLLVAAKRSANDWNDRAKQKTRASQKEIAELRKKRTAFENRLGTAILAEDSALTELKASEIALRKMRGEEAEIRAELGSLSVKIDVLTDELTRVESGQRALKESKTCPTCGQPVKASNLKTHWAELEERCNDIDVELTNACGIREKKVLLQTAKKKAIGLAEKAADKFDEKARNAGDEILRVRPEIAELDKKIAAATSNEEENPYTKQVGELTTRRNEIALDIKSIERDLDLTRTTVEHSKYWIKGFKEIKLQLIEDVLSELELVANSMIEEVGLVGWQIGFDIEKEAKSGNITNMINVQVSSPQSKKPVRWEAFSGGECQRLRLIGSLALADVLLAHAGIETNLEILDEPAVYWASEGIQELASFLDYRARERDKSIFFIEHSAVESVHFARVWTVRNDATGAKVIGVEDGSKKDRKSYKSREAARAQS